MLFLTHPARAVKRFREEMQIATHRYSHTACQFGVERVAQAIAYQVDGQDRQSQAEARKQHNPEGNLHVGAAFGHDVAPTGDDGRSSSAKKAEVRLKND